jgi:hypothetical protein
MFCVPGEKVPGELDGAEGWLTKFGYGGTAPGQVQVREMAGRLMAERPLAAESGQRERYGTRRLC